MPLAHSDALRSLVCFAETWHGVKVQGGRVTQLDLRDNGVMGALPGELGELTALVTLGLHLNNGITSKYVELFVIVQYSSSSPRRSTSDSCSFAAVPDSISKLVNLTDLSLSHTKISSERKSN